MNSDYGGENRAFDDFSKQGEIRHIYTMPYTPQQNKIIERRNQTILDMMKLMMSYSEMSLQLQRETFSAVAYILNGVHKKANSLTPDEIWTGTKHDLSKLKVWGCKNYILIPKTLRVKISART